MATDEVRPTPIGRGAAALELAVALVATIALLALFPASHAAHVDIVRRILTPGKMLALVLLATWLQRRHGGGWRELGIRTPRPWWRAPLLAIGGYLVGMTAAGIAAKTLLPALHLPQPAIPAFLHTVRGDLPEYLYWIIPVTWGSAAFGEEMLFRGFMLDRLDALMGRRSVWAAVVIQALIFGSAHAYLGPSGAILAGILGLVLGAVFVLGGRNLWPAIVVHGLVDSTSMTAVFLGLAPH
jgi:membrane protease YdiL (CAAX protease family)